MDIIITILVYQLINLIVVIISNENTTALMYSACGFPTLVCQCVSWIYRKARLMYARRKYNAYQFFSSKSQIDNLGWCGTFYMTPKFAERFRQTPSDFIPSEDYTIRLVREGKQFRSAPYKSDILTEKHLEAKLHSLMTPENLKLFLLKED